MSGAHVHSFCAVSFVRSVPYHPSLPSAGSSQCTACPTGKTQNAIGQSSCDSSSTQLVCSAGTYATSLTVTNSTNINRNIRNLLCGVCGVLFFSLHSRKKKHSPFFFFFLFFL